MNRIKLDEVQETLLIPLWARAQETMRPQRKRMLEDYPAVEMVRKIDFDFSRIGKARLSMLGTVVRSVILDREVKKFIQRHPDAVCINLACGLDTRFDRVDNGRIDWYDLDFPEVTRLREELLGKPSGRVHTISASMLDDWWTGEVSDGGRPVLIIMEGVSMYLTGEEMEQLFRILTDRFPFSLMLLEVATSFFIRHQKMHDTSSFRHAPFKWGIDRAEEVERLHPGITLLDCWGLFGECRWRWGLMGALSLIPWVSRRCDERILYLSIAA